MTSFLFVPPYREHTQSPYAILVSQKDSDAFQLREVYWPLCGGQAVTEEACEESEPFSSEEFANISLHFECTLPPGYSFQQEDFQFDIVNVTEFTNGTFCHAGSSSSSPPSDLFNLAVRCFVNEDYLETCVSVEGSHAKTFWIYFAFDCLYILGMNSMFALLDGTALHLTSQHGSHYSYVMMWNILGAACAPLVSGFAIQEPEPGGTASN